MVYLLLFAGVANFLFGLSLLDTTPAEPTGYMIVGTLLCIYACELGKEYK